MSKIKITLPKNFKFPRIRNLMVKAWTPDEIDAFCAEMENILNNDPKISNMRLASQLETKFGKSVDLSTVIIPIMKASGLMTNREKSKILKRV